MSSQITEAYSRGYLTGTNPYRVYSLEHDACALGRLDHTDGRPARRPLNAGEIQRRLRQARGNLLAAVERRAAEAAARGTLL